jgi:PAS domain S-box-containing protein
MGHELQPDALAIARLAAIVSSSEDAIVSKDLNGIITSWNGAAERLLGYTAEEIIGRHISTISLPGREKEMSAILEKIRRGERVEHFDTERRHKDGSLVQVSLTVSPIHDSEGRIIGASKIARDISERRRAEEQLRFLTRELDHRAKNVLAIAQAMLRLTRADSLPDYIDAIEGRIGALARVHSQVAEKRWGGAEMGALINAGLEPFAARRDRISIEGPRLLLSPAAAQVIGILVHELATNGAKHGALSGDGGTINVSWSLTPSGDLIWRWTEHGGPAVAAPSRLSFGMQVISRSVPDQLGGDAKVNWLPDGLQCEFVVPAEHLPRVRGRDDAFVEA